MPLRLASADELDVSLVKQIVLCGVPFAALLAAGYPVYAGAACGLVTGAFWFWHMLHGDAKAMLTLVVGTLPIMMLSRGIKLPLITIVAMSVVSAVLMLHRHPEHTIALRKQRPLLMLLVLMLIYWWLTYLNTWNYMNNLRGLELAFATLAVFLLGRSRRHLSTGLLGVAISTIALGVGCLPHGSRLGEARIAGMNVGNPILVGLPAALMLVVLVAEQGTWAGLRMRPSIRLLLSLSMAALLFLSTSRGSWLIGIVGLVALVIVGGQGQRKVVLYTCAGTVAALMLVLASGRGAGVQSYLDKTFDTDKTWAKRTTGRSEQWKAFPAVLKESPVYGHGAGTGPELTARFAGKKLLWHSLYLQVGAETGLIGLVLLMIILADLLFRGVVHWLATTQVVPLVSAVCFLIVGVSVSGLDALSGIYLGLATLGMDYRRIRVMRPARLTTVVQQEAAA